MSDPKNGKFSAGDLIVGTSGEDNNIDDVVVQGLYRASVAFDVNEALTRYCGAARDNAWDKGFFVWLVNDGLCEFVTYTEVWAHETKESSGQDALKLEVHRNTIEDW